MKTQGVSLLFLDEHPENCEGVAALIRARRGYLVLVASARIEAAIRSVVTTKPDVVLLNLEPGNGRMALAGALHGAVPESRVIILCARPADEDVAALVRAQVSGFIMADASFEQFLATVHSVVRGVQVLPPALASPLFRYLNPHKAPRRLKRALDLRRLSGREREVAALVIRGISNREIGRQLRITLPTVKSHVHHVLSKLAVKSRVEVASFFDRSGIPGTDSAPRDRPALTDVVPIPLV